MRAAASGRMSFSMLHCSRKMARKNRRMRSAAGMRLSSSGDMGVSLVMPFFERHVRLLQLIRDCAVGTHQVGYAVGQDHLQPVDGSIASYALDRIVIVARPQFRFLASKDGDVASAVAVEIFNLPGTPPPGLGAMFALSLH